MYYPLDFRQRSGKQKKNYIFNVSVLNEEFTVNNKSKISSVGKKKEESVWKRYCNNATVHGLRYLTEPSVKHNERLVWLLVITMALFGAMYISYLLQVRYARNKLATVVETTIYPVSEIPYPAITICNNNRINWLRVPETIDYFLKNASDETIGKLRDIIIGLNTFEYSSFEEFERFQDVDLDDLSHINITELYTKLVHSCEEMFVDPCWWRNKYMKCCGENALFVLQRSEYGICYSFNSILNTEGSRRYLNEKNFPWRTSKFGDWSGLRTKIQINSSTKIPNFKRKDGIHVMVQHPFTWPINSNFIPVGTIASIKMKPIYSYATPAALKLKPVERQCLHKEEALEYNYETLPGTQYFFNNCICSCRMKYLISACNCTLDIIYPSANYTQCKITDLRCLHQKNDLFNHEKPSKKSQYFSDKEEGMVCNCLPECETIDYVIDVTPLRGSEIDDDNQIVLDVHFQRSSIFKYRTDIVFDWLDLMVGFGGIVGLFLGVSLISIAEFALYVGIGVIKCLHDIKQLTQRVMNKN